ncbi:MAG: GNAT family N-acetyltransferase [Anaerolineae bacterium]|nr:GNAT family N-acetyltransferase [Anaerolineae bacterium]
MIERVDQDKRGVTEDALRAQLEWHGHDPERDRWVIEHPTTPREFVAHAWVFQQTSERCNLHVSVHPDWRRQGLGTQLLAEAIIRAEAYKAGHVLAYICGKDDSRQAFPHHHGFRRMGDSWTLRFNQETIPEPVLPDGYVIRTHAQFNHLPSLSTLMHRCYHDRFGHAENTRGVVTPEYIRNLMEKYPDHFPADSMFLVIHPFGKAIGFVKAVHGNVIDSPGVVPEERGGGWYRTLALIAMRQLRERGADQIELLSYGDSLETIREYQELGFKVSDHYLAYQKDLPKN